MPAIPSSYQIAQFYSVPLPGATATEFPALDGLVEHDNTRTVMLRNGATGSFLIQDRAVRSTETGQLDFYYRITNQGTEPVKIANAFLGFWFAELPGLYELAPITFADFRSDGLGTVAPKALELWPFTMQGQTVRTSWAYYAFRFDHVFQPGESTRFFFVSTRLTTFTIEAGGISLTSSDDESLFASSTIADVLAASPLVPDPELSPRCLCR